MDKKAKQRKYRSLTAEERERHRKIREEEAAGKKEESKRIRRLIQRLWLSNVFKALKAEREAQGLSLADIYKRCGIDRADISKLENADDPNCRMSTIHRYATALGKKVEIQLVDDPDA